MIGSTLKRFVYQLWLKVCRYFCCVKSCSGCVHIQAIELAENFLNFRLWCIRTDVWRVFWRHASTGKILEKKNIAYSPRTAVRGTGNLKKEWVKCNMAGSWLSPLSSKPNREGLYFYPSSCARASKYAQRHATNVRLYLDSLLHRSLLSPNHISSCDVYSWNKNWRQNAQDSLKFYTTMIMLNNDTDNTKRCLSLIRYTHDKTPYAKFLDRCHYTHFFKLMLKGSPVFKITIR
jgi:hypothetical protein